MTCSVPKYGVRVGHAVAGNLWFSPGTFFLPSKQAGVWGVETVSLSVHPAGNGRGRDMGGAWAASKGLWPGTIFDSSACCAPLAPPPSRCGWPGEKGPHARIPRPPRERVVPAASHLSIPNGCEVARGHMKGQDLTRFLAWDGYWPPQLPLALGSWAQGSPQPW